MEVIVGEFLSIEHIRRNFATGVADVSPCGTGDPLLLEGLEDDIVRHIVLLLELLDSEGCGTATPTGWRRDHSGSCSPSRSALAVKVLRSQNTVSGEAVVSRAGPFRPS
jgi:hypothetical protein